MSIPQKRTHAEFESNAVKSNIKEQRLLEKNINILNVEEAYAMRILNLDSRDINHYRNKMNERTSKIKSHLTTVDIIKMKELEASGKMKGVGNKTASASSAILAAAEKRLNIKPRAKTALPVRQYDNNRKYSPNIEDSRSDDTNTPSQEESREYRPKSLVKQPSLSNLHQMSANDSADQDNNTTWARPSPKPRKRPNTAFVPSSHNVNGSSGNRGTSIPSPVVKSIVIPTAENVDDTVSDIEELPNDQVFMPCEEEKPPTVQEVPIEKPAPRPKYRELPVPPKRQERGDRCQAHTKPEKSNKQTRCPYKGTPMRVVPSATQISMVCNDSTQSTAVDGQHRTSRPGSGIPVRNGDAKQVKRRPQTAKHVSNEDRAMEHFPQSHNNNEVSRDTNRPKTAKVPPSLGYAEIHRNRRVRSPDHTSSSRSRQSRPDNQDFARSPSRQLPVRPDRSPSTRIPVRPVTAHSYSVEIEQEAPRPVPQRRLSRPRTAKANVNPVYTSAISTNVPEYSAPENTLNTPTLPPPISPRDNMTPRLESKSLTSALSTRQSQDPSSQSMTDVPRHVPIAPQQRASIVPRTPRVVTVTSSSSKRINASVVDRLNDFSSVLPYASSGNSGHSQANEIPMVLQSKHTSSDQPRESHAVHPSHSSSDQRTHVANGDQDPLPGNQQSSAHLSKNHEAVVDYHYKQASHTTQYQQQPNTQTSIPRPGSARPRAAAQVSHRSPPEDEAVSSASDFRRSLSRAYDTNEHVISAKPPRPMQRPTTARTQITTGDPPAARTSIPRPRTARMLPTTPQHRPQLEKYPTQTGTERESVVTQAIIHSPRPPSAPAERRIQAPGQTEYVTHDASVPAPSRIAVRTKTPKKPSALKFHFDSHKIATEKHQKEQEENLPPKVYSSFEEAMADYLERAAADNVFNENVLQGFRKSLIKLEKLKFAKIEDKMTLFLNKMDEYLERSGKIIPDWFKPLRFKKTVEEPVIVTFDPATYFKNRRKCKYQHNKAAFERQNKKDTDPNMTWNGIKKCRYLRIPNEMIDHSGMRTLGTDQIQLMKTLKGID
ncbi:nascent polypeptide-associated complex subunit alpha, muscle-specific form-like [Pecten maximus]|uniref:nascent polypeptide-associated complex subunit alpha, muscle-specific form-like n=1 Tax=Pecten maximus TaxID=6579 RepID=UPI0014588066|nr:nascent polypeptide-associated complex subunit alpha, muscle-specific form-like [Pecten maximus]